MCQNRDRKINEKPLYVDTKSYIKLAICFGKEIKKYCISVIHYLSSQAQKNSESQQSGFLLLSFLLIWCRNL